MDRDTRVNARLIDAAVQDRAQAAAAVVLATWVANRYPGLGHWHACEAGEAGGQFIGGFR